MDTNIVYDYSLSPPMNPLGHLYDQTDVAAVFTDVVSSELSHKKVVPSGRFLHVITNLDLHRQTMLYPNLIERQSG